MSDLQELLHDAKVIVCVGSGGVGKTTTSALLGMEAARRGRKVLVMTIDPARRLASSLGIADLDHAVQRVDLSAYGEASNAVHGELYATMLDMKKAFDAIVERYAADETSRQAIFDNRFYRFFSTSLAGAQELSASERLFEVVDSGDYDLVILDTPPTTNALDFLEAPHRYFDALDSSVLHFVMQAGSAMRGGRLGNLANQLILRGLGRFTGTELFVELADFFTHFSGLFEGFRERTRATASLFSHDATRFVIISAPDPATMGEALYFRSRLERYDVRLGAVVVNRIHPSLRDNPLTQASPQAIADALLTLPGAAIHGRPRLEQLAYALRQSALEFQDLADRDREVLSALETSVASSAPVVAVPLLATDVHTLEGLDRLRQHLFPST